MCKAGGTDGYVRAFALPHPVGRDQSGPYTREASPLLKSLPCLLT